MEKKITISGNISEQINFAMQQNYVPVIRNVILTNNSSADLEHVSLQIRFVPEFAKPFQSSELFIKAGQSIEISPIQTIIDSEYLFSLTEKMVGSISIEAIIDGEKVATETRSIELLAYDQWTGTGFMPELTAAFVQPNHPKITELLSKASLYLQKWTGDPSFTGYQFRNANIVKQQMCAIYAALQEENIAYTMPPASFELAQRLRTPDMVLETKSGTCIDLAILYCSCLEAIGLNPLLIFLKEHAFVGCWLENETFPDSIQYDYTALTKRAAKGIDAMSFVECTLFTVGKEKEFDTAEQIALKSLNDSEAFDFALDITRTRSAGIRPIPARVSENGTYKAVDYGIRKESEITSAPSELDMIGTISVDGEKREVTKQMIWERKLLDMSLRNNLLNFRPGTMNVQLLASDLGNLENVIADGESFQIMPIPEDMILNVADSKIFEYENDITQIETMIQSEFKSRRLRTFLKESDLEKIMKKLHRQARVSMEENGANTIYLALGFLRWYETEKSDKARHAPLILIPIEITRKVQDKSFSIHVRDEDTQINITLLEMLRQVFGIDIQGLDPIPEDEHGVNLPLIFATIRKAILAKDRWDISDFAFVGQFSFSRFIMWNDIRNRSDELAQNKVVASLISGKTEWTSENIDDSPLELDRNINPSDLAVPVSADSSQLAAINAANSDSSFVLHGPPGTGKSQTITNMIANALHHGKTVLFVAEKMAALEVVEKRLDKIGLGPFCLELHSNKAQKREVLGQLEDTLNVGKIKEPEEFEAQAEKIRNLRNELNGTMEEIHKIRNYGCSLYDAIVKYEKNKDLGGVFSFTQSQLSSANKETISLWTETLERLSAAGKEYGTVANSPLQTLKITECTPDTKQKLETELQAMKNAVHTTCTHSEMISELCGTNKLSYKQYKSLVHILENMQSDAYILEKMIQNSDWELYRSTSEKIIENGLEQSALKTEILSNFEPTVLNYDSANALIKLKTARSKWALPRFFAVRKLITELNAHAKTPKFVNSNTIDGYYEKLNRLHTLTSEINETNATLIAIYGPLWMGTETNWTLLKNSVAFSEDLKQNIQNSEFEEATKKSIISVLSSKFSSPSMRTEKREKIDQILADAQKVEIELSKLSEYFSMDIDSLTAGDDWKNAISERIDQILPALSHLKEWTIVNKICEQLGNQGLEDSVQKYLKGAVSTEHLSKAFETDLYRSLVSNTISSNSVLSGFQGAMFEETIRKYHETLEQFSKLTINELVAELSAKIPRISGTSATSSEIGILQKAIKSKGRMMSIRKLFDSIPNLLRRMCPVMLMSPISVAQYIDPSYPKFDLVIFDEASQLPTCEAVGAIARGDNVIIVGDPKQLPPTSFFSTNQTDEENYEKEDLESVLDDCLALSMPQKHLLWHYRSRHESLIAYSNAKYYDNKLYTFPSPDDQTSEVSWVHVDGYYDKSSTRTNKAEAKAIIAEITRRLEDPSLRKKSIGVVTFSQSQQNLVDDLLTDAYRERPELEAWANEQYEPILIKNLENVQGDERDVILFSIGYGPDKEGKISMNFGPLNRDGGWRRLNVAISRSKCQMIVFSVISPDQIDLSRTRSEGVEGLKGFLEFASKGRSALTTKGTASTSESRFGEIVAKELRSRGYHVNCSVGCSDFKIDIAIADPDSPDTYILGISCGEKNSYENSNAKDRHISQDGVLKGLGWNVMHIYILDWLDHPEKVLSKIEEKIKACKEEKNQSKMIEEPTKSENHPLVFEKEDDIELSDLCDQYFPYAVKIYGNAEQVTAKNGAVMKQCVNEILLAEAPISRVMLTKNVLASFGMVRTTTAVSNAIDQAIEDCGATTTFTNDHPFIWHASQNPEQYTMFRRSWDAECKRGIDEISAEEIANGIKLILSRQISMTKDDLVHETSKLLGISRVTSSAEAIISCGISNAERRGYISSTEDGKIKLLDES